MRQTLHWTFFIDFNLDHIVEEKQNASANSALGIQSAGIKQRCDKAVEPIHAEYFVLNERPERFHSQSHSSTHSSAAINALNFFKVSQQSE